MSNRRPSIDGFIPRQPGSRVGELHGIKNRTTTTQPVRRTIHTNEKSTQDRVGEPRVGREMQNDDVLASLRHIDDENAFAKGINDEDKGRKGRRQRKKDNKKPKSKAKRIAFWVSMGLIAAIVLVVGYLIFKGVFASGNIFKGNIFDIVQNQPLKEDKNGRSNFVIFGTAEDDEGGEHGGANLTDSIMVLSINQKKKDAYMLSLPRDLWVKYAETCTVGNQGKLNAAYFCASDDGKNEAEGAAALQKKVGEVTGLDIQYYAHLNFTAVVEAVDAVGGVDVTIQSEDPRGILDRNFDWKCGYRCHYVNYKNGQKVHLDGEHALALSRARNAAGGYGLPNGNFDREKNQQMIVKALREKALSAGTLTNLGAVTKLIDALGNNLRTNVETKEIRTLMNLASEIQSDKIVSLSLVSEDNMLVTTGMYMGQSIVRPTAGIMDYSDIHSYIQTEMSSEPHVKEHPKVVVLNGSGVAGAAQEAAERLEGEGFTILDTGNAPDGSYARREVYSLVGEKKPASVAKLQQIYSGVTFKTSKPPVSVLGDADFVVIVGK
ncbi:LCP family protein [Candidatus Saccharibacteria bacterium TM7i]|nr:LCP family protein [Candidatus Saccharibacteria bacterium TM7i]